MMAGGVYGRSPAMLILPYLRAENRRRNMELRDEIEHGIKVCWTVPKANYTPYARVPTDAGWVKLVRFKRRRKVLNRSPWPQGLGTGNSPA